jgi:hypothetical protein
MRGFIYFALVLLLFPLTTQAQEITQQPICFKLRNTAEFSIWGSFVTDYYTRNDGTKAKHRSNFRLEAAGSKDAEKGFPTDAAEFCSYGPFYPNRQIELVLRTIVPVFTCKTSVEAGEIVLRGERKAEGGVKMWAECL